MFQLCSVSPSPPVKEEGHPPPVGFGSSGGLWSPWGLLRRGRPLPPPCGFWALWCPLVGYGPLGCS